jgi:hypothetical protein
MLVRVEFAPQTEQFLARVEGDQNTEQENKATVSEHVKGVDKTVDSLQQLSEASKDDEWLSGDD